MLSCAREPSKNHHVSRRAHPSHRGSSIVPILVPRAPSPARAHRTNPPERFIRTDRYRPRIPAPFARARARRSPSLPARDRGDPKGFRAAPVVILPRRAPPVALLPRRATKTRASSKVPVVRRSHLHDGTLARRVKRRRRQPRARLVSGLARWSPAGCSLSPSYFYTLTEHHHGYAHVSNTSLVYITTCPTKSRPHTPRTRTPRRRTRFAKFAKDGWTDAFDWIGFRMSLDRPLDVARRRR